MRFSLNERNWMYEFKSVCGNIEILDICNIKMFRQSISFEVYKINLSIGDFSSVKYLMKHTIYWFQPVITYEYMHQFYPLRWHLRDLFPNKSESLHMNEVILCMCVLCTKTYTQTHLYKKKTHKFIYAIWIQGENYWFEV